MLTPSLTKPPTRRRLTDLAAHVVEPEGIVSTAYPSLKPYLERAGIPLDPWQEGIAARLLGKRESGQYACGIGGAVLSIPRQTGKTHLLGAIAFALCMRNADTLVVWSAHRSRTHNETFKGMAALAERQGVAPLVEHVVRAAGQEGIRFVNGSRILFGAREHGFGRGFAKIDVLVLDEAQILSEKAMEDLVPATNASPNGLALLAGTPPRPSDPGEVFTLRREAALSGEDKDVFYVEFSADKNANPDDRSAWRKANPSFPSRTTEGAILRMRKLLGSVESFKREGLGIWDERQQGKRAFPPGAWAARVAEAPEAGVRSFGVKFSPDGAHVAIAGALRVDENRVHVEAIRQAPMSEGTQWLVDFLVERKGRAAQIIVDGKAGVGYLVNALRAEKVGKSVLLIPTVDQAIMAHSMLDRAVIQGEVSHSGQADLDVQAEGAMRREIGKAGGFGWESGVEGESTALLDAVTLAHYAAKTTKRDPSRRQTFL